MIYDFYDLTITSDLFSKLSVYLPRETPRRDNKSVSCKNKSKVKPSENIREVISLNILVSRAPGIITNHKGNPTVKRYIGYTVFVDQYYDFTFHLISKIDTEATVKVKLVFGIICYSYGVRVLYYHADNGLFDTKRFKESFNTAKQTIRFYRVNAHHQNGIAKNVVKDVTT